MGEVLRYRRLDGSGFGRIVLEDCPLKIPVEPRVDEWVKTDSGNLFPLMGMPRDRSEKERRTYYLTRDERWVRHKPFDGGLTEVTPGEVIRDLEANGIQLPAELKTDRQEPAIRPRWEAEARRLWYGEIVCRDFSKRRAWAQMDIVVAFHRAEWESPIRAPFSEKTLRDNIASLNRGLKQESPIVFEPHGPERMAWKPR